MVVCWVFWHITRELSNLYSREVTAKKIKEYSDNDLIIQEKDRVLWMTNLGFLNKVPLEWAKQNLPLTWFKAIYHWRYWSLQVRQWEENQLLVNEITILDSCLMLVKVSTRLKNGLNVNIDPAWMAHAKLGKDARGNLKVGKPLFPISNPFLAEC